MKNYNSTLSLELQTLIEAIKVVLLKRPNEKFVSMIHLSTLDWLKIQKMLEYHQIRPIFYEACRIIGFDNDYVSKLRVFTKRQIMVNLATSQELGRLLELFQEKEIEMLPYKGALFLEKIYQNHPFRESSDVDVLVKPKNAFESIKILMADGYKISPIFTDIKNFDDEILHEVLERSQWKEIGLYKPLPSGVVFHLDFHWEFNETFHIYNTPMEELFEKSIIDNFQKRQLLIPSKEIIFKMMLNHHGGRGCWLRLKDFCDLLAFRKQFAELPIEKLNLFASEMKMQRIFSIGSQIIDEIFLEIPHSKTENQGVIKKILDFWGESNRYDSTLPKLYFKNIYRLIQDQPISWLSLIHRHIKYYAVPNKVERKRLFVLPDRFVYLNAFSKFLTYSIYRYSLRKF